MYKHFFKRFFDVLFGLIALPFLLLIFIILAPIIYFDDKGPIIYVSKRVGKNEKIFNMYKFRSMKVNAPNLLNPDGSTYNSEKDERQTRVGKWLRKTSIDELPQIFNVLKGNMSFIGPRPVLDMQLASFTEEEKKKLKVLPGITGYSQAYSRNQMASHEERMTDAWYAEHVSFWLDIKILFKTIQTVLKPNSVYRNKAEDVAQVHEEQAQEKQTNNLVDQEATISVDE